MDNVSTPRNNKPKPEPYYNWEALSEVFSRLPYQVLDFDSDGELSEIGWAFRGHKSTDYHLQPRIEREAPKEWAALELQMLAEFQSRARMVLNPSDVPEPDDRLSWLALMQHYGVPTRLLDFTFSPYVALYFALRDREETGSEKSAALWAIDVRSVMAAAKKRSWEADKEEREYKRKNEGTSIFVTLRGASLDPRFFRSNRDSLEDETMGRRRMLSNALSPGCLRRAHFNEHGFVALAMPPSYNRRLSSQQGAFLFNGAEDLSFEDSFFAMMNGCDAEWLKYFEIPAEELPLIERKLFTMNIHDLSLFPDMEGLAGFIRQKTRLHWLPSGK